MVAYSHQPEQNGIVRFLIMATEPVIERIRRLLPMKLRYFPLDRVGFMQRPVYEGLPASGGSASPEASRVGPLPYYRGGSSATIQVSTARS